MCGTLDVIRDGYWNGVQLQSAYEPESMMMAYSVISSLMTARSRKKRLPLSPPRQGAGNSVALRCKALNEYKGAPQSPPPINNSLPHHPTRQILLLQPPFLPAQQTPIKVSLTQRQTLGNLGLSFDRFNYRAG